MTDSAAVVRPMGSDDLAAADRVYRLAFGTQFGLPDPSRFRGDAQVLRGRWTTDPRPCFVAERDRRIVGSIVGMDWGSVFVLGPLTVDPAYADRGIGRLLMRPAMDFIAARGFALAGLFTFPASPKHVHLYESYGFVPQHLTPVLSSVALDSRLRGNDGIGEHANLLSDLPPAARAAARAACRAVSDAVFPGLDLTHEIEAIATQGLGDTVLLRDGGGISGFALCHGGAGSEAGSGVLFVKFACVRPGDAAGFMRLVEACERLAAVRGASRLVAGVNRARDGAYRAMRERGFRADLIGVAMHRPDGAGYNRPEIYAIDDWR
ncbi:MAG: GNAT family N-acetyltransferase [Alphaproteobacteria bacterium]|nr:GNAT family N-acetyltransferase [Alphaproteobacteria bacterium]